ncbi:glutamate/aspartate transport system substrate-binding protein [Rhodoferax sp. OV413]|uniref:amino acid ABC transporter substrate-binding protein n=1 Tax=Rhodoferax sp. OV413 TaxID=1855285 RepID=UPI000881E1D5|nr:amino acid ABC transporter substrate-binding protein [Rhodoferax sp. OV413]SDP71951.1 glutamate/aspartate transport system substrate-binding protein [Rhodoferax sp. OV413]
MQSVWTKPLAAGLLACLLAGLAQAQVLTGTLKKALDAGTVTLGYRESSIPFSYLSARGEPIGYAVDICRALVDAMGEEMGRELLIKWQPVTSESRIHAVVSGQVDMECGSTTSNLERQKLVAFSPTTFVSGTKLMVRKGSVVRSFRDLVGKRVVVTAGTTNEKAMRELSEKFKLNLDLLVSRDHAESFALLAADKADAFATDDVLLYGLLAQNKGQADYAVVGDFLSYDPYAIMYRKGDAQLAALVNKTFGSLAEEGDLERLYKRWFLRRLPSGVSINLPMSPQLATIIQTMGVKPE